MNNSLGSLLNERQISQILGISVSTLRRWRSQQTGVRFLRIGHLVRYRRDDLEDFVATCALGPAKGVN